jgi:hypothetical protein
MGLEQISIGIKTFLRDQKLYNAVDAIRRTLPETQIVIADDGRRSDIKTTLYTVLDRDGHIADEVPFDSGFGFKSNYIAGIFERDLLLIASDDFDFNPPSVRAGILKMLDVLENTDVDVASGRVRGPYEFDLEDLGDIVIEHRRNMSALDSQSWFVECDLTVNYSLVKRRVFDNVQWDLTKIAQGEHGAWFLDVKRAGYKVAWVPGVQIQEQEGADNPEYNSYRGRYNGSKERSCFVKRGIRKYILGSGQVDYEAGA